MVKIRVRVIECLLGRAPGIARGVLVHQDGLLLQRLYFAVGKLRGQRTLEPHAVIVTAAGEKEQVDYGDGAMVRHPLTREPRPGGGGVAAPRRRLTSGGGRLVLLHDDVLADGGLE
jgi:hypothetical protein